MAIVSTYQNKIWKNWASYFTQKHNWVKEDFQWWLLLKTTANWIRSKRWLVLFAHGWLIALLDSTVCELYPIFQISNPLKIPELILSNRTEINYLWITVLISNSKYSNTQDCTYKTDSFTVIICYVHMYAEQAELVKK